MEIGNPAGDIFRMTNIKIPDDFSVGGVKKRHPVSAPVARTGKSAFGIAFCLFQNILGTDFYLLGFEDSQ